MPKGLLQRSSGPDLGGTEESHLRWVPLWKSQGSLSSTFLESQCLDDRPGCQAVEGNVFIQGLEATVCIHVCDQPMSGPEIKRKADLRLGEEILPSLTKDKIMIPEIRLISEWSLSNREPVQLHNGHTDTKAGRGRVAGTVQWGSSSAFSLPTWNTSNCSSFRVISEIEMLRLA